MNFSTDRDLLALEPNLFSDASASYVSQKRANVTDAVIAGTTLTSATADFEAAQVEAGAVVVVNDVAMEVIERVDANTLTVSLPRTSVTDDAIPPGDGSALTLIAVTFAPQAKLVHDTLLRLLRIDPDVTAEVASESGFLSEDAIVSLSLMAHIEALGALELVYAGAASVAGDNTELIRRTEQYHRRFRAALERATVLIDSNGDGQVDTQASLATARLVRA